MSFRDFGGRFGYFKKDLFNKCELTMCWSGIKGLINLEIYIYDFRIPETENYISLLIDIINKITPCEIIQINDIQYIKYKMLDTYDQNLVLLNFIRNLWYSPTFNSIAYKIKDYSITFFKYLEASKVQSPLERLMQANIDACKDSCETLKLQPGHCNIFPGKHKIKSAEELKSWKGVYVMDFFIK